MQTHDRTNRRRFLKGGILTAAAAVAVPQFIAGRVFGCGGSEGANERIIVGIIGMGMRGNQLVSNIPSGGHLAAVCDADSRKTAAALKRFGADWKIYGDYRKMFEQKRVDAVIVCPCDHQHVQAGMMACQAGLDAYVEKPLSNYVVEGRMLVKAARKYGRVVQTGSQQRSMEMDRFACELVRDGGIGKLRGVECVNFTCSLPYPPKGLPEEPIPTGLDWDLWQGPAPRHPFNRLLFAHHTEGLPMNWGSWRDYSPGSTGGMGGHAYDMVQYALGMDETGPVDFTLLEKPSLSARVDFRYANGIEVQLKFADKPPFRGPRLGGIFIGEECKIEINRNKFTTNPENFVTNGPDPKLAEKWEGEGFIAKGHIQNWFDCIKSRGKPIADVEIGHRTATIGHLINIVRQVGHQGQTFRWDPVAERFTNSDEGNKLLDRPRRKGWELPEV
jgi:predicted dehydrogenase